MPRIEPSTEAAIEEAARRLRAGDVVAFPTETVYGLGADAFNPDALRKIFDLKGRPFNNPLIAHVLDVKQARSIASTWYARCDELAARFWPGPLTMVLPKAALVPDLATAGLQSIAVRAPAHPVARQFLSTFGSPICAPSANRSGQVSPTRAEHVAADFDDVAALLILDGGPCDVGIESTVVDLTATVPQVLRPGRVTAQQLRTVLPELDEPNISLQSSSPGTAASHYAPRTPAELVESAGLHERLRGLREPAAVLCMNPANLPPPHRAIVMPADPHDYANRLYDALRQADGLKLRQIIIEAPPDSEGLWRAIHDRLRRATIKGQ